MVEIIFIAVLVIALIASLVAVQSKEDNKETVSEYMEKNRAKKPSKDMITLTYMQVEKYFGIMDEDIEHEMFADHFLGAKQFHIDRKLFNEWEEKAKCTLNKKEKMETWGKEFYLSIKNRNHASELEKSGDLYGAIAIYEMCVNEGINSKMMNILNYAHDIERLFILYRKTKQNEKEISFLKEMILLHPEYRNSYKWEERLSKLEKIQNK